MELFNTTSLFIGGLLISFTVFSCLMAELNGGKKASLAQPGQTDQERIASLELEVKRLKKLLEGEDLSGIYPR